MKLLQGCALVLVIIILIPIAASCAGISLLAIGTAPLIRPVATQEPAPSQAPAIGQPWPDSPGGGAAPEDPGAIEARGREISDDAEAAADDLLAAADDVLSSCDPDDGEDAYDACLDAYDAALDLYDAALTWAGVVQDCVTRAESMAAVEACGDH